jgi:hypothetical protein
MTRIKGILAAESIADPREGDPRSDGDQQVSVPYLLFDFFEDALHPLRFDRKDHDLGLPDQVSIRGKRFQTERFFSVFAGLPREYRRRGFAPSRTFHFESTP